MKKDDKDFRFIPRLGTEARESISRHGTVLSKKGYRRKGRGIKRALEKDIADQIKNSDHNLFMEEFEFYFLEASEFLNDDEEEYDFM